MKELTHWRSIVLAISLAAALIGPWILSNFWMTIATNTVIFAIFAQGLNILVGHAGLPSLGHAAFFGVGAYTVALLTRAGWHNMTLLMVAALATAGLLAALLARILLRMRDMYFLMATVAVGEIFRNIAVSWRSVTGGDDGLRGISRPSLWGWELTSRITFYYVTLASLIAVTAIVGLMMRARLGNLLRAVRDNRSRMQVLGVNARALDTTAWIISGLFAALAGALYVYFNRFVSPSVFSVEVSGRALLMVVLGGAATLSGPIIGAIVIEAVRGIGSSLTDRWLTILGVLYVIVALDPKARIQSYFYRRRRAQTRSSMTQPAADRGGAQ